MLEYFLISGHVRTIRKKRFKVLSIFVCDVTKPDHRQSYGGKYQQRNPSRVNCIHSETSLYNKSPIISPPQLPMSPNILPPTAPPTTAQTSAPGPPVLNPRTTTQAPPLPYLPHTLRGCRLPGHLSTPSFQHIWRGGTAPPGPLCRLYESTSLWRPHPAQYRYTCLS